MADNFNDIILAALDGATKDPGMLKPYMADAQNQPKPEHPRPRYNPNLDGPFEKLWDFNNPLMPEQYLGDQDKPRPGQGYRLQDTDV